MTFRSPCKLCALLRWPIVLWQRQTIVVRLVSIEELAGIDMFCSDKTDTLTQNIMINVSKFPWCGTSEQGVVVVCTAGFGVNPERKGCH